MSGKCSWMYKAAIASALFALFTTLLAKLIMPIKLVDYVEILPNGKVVVDKKLLEEIRHPPIVEFALWAVGNGALADWLIPLDVDSIANSALAKVGDASANEFWTNTADGEPGPTGPTHLASSYAHTYWHRHLTLLLEASKTEGKPYLSAFGRFALRDSCVEALRVQLLIVKLWKEHGEEIARERIDRPIVISGPPRSMTTHAQSILSKHPDVWFLRFSEGRDPLLPPGLDANKVFTSEDPRHKLLNLGSWLVSYLRPFFYYMFRFDKKNMGDSPQEDIFLQALVFGSAQYETNTYIPSYSALWHGESNRATFRFMKMTQQVMQWEKNRLFGKRTHEARWIMKTPEHVGFVRDLMEVYPDAMWVLTHRDPVPVVKSFIPMILYIQGLWNAKVDAELFAEYQLVSLEKRLNKLVEQIDLIPQNQVMHVAFKEFNEDNVKLMERICRFAGLRWDDSTAQGMKEYIANSPRNGANKFEYRIETLGKGYDPDTLKRRFQAYSERFKEYI